MQPLAHLLVDGSLTELVMLGRWRRAKEIFNTFPPAAWLERTAGLHYTPACAELATGQFRSLAMHLRRWYAFLPEGSEEDGRIGEEQQLMERSRVCIC